MELTISSKKQNFVQFYKTLYQAYCIQLLATITFNFREYFGKLCWYEDHSSMRLVML